MNVSMLCYLEVRLHVYSMRFRLIIAKKIHSGGFRNKKYTAMVFNI